MASKTVGKWFTADQAADYEAWIANHRRIRELIAHLEALGITQVESDPRASRVQETR